MPSAFTEILNPADNLEKMKIQTFEDENYTVSAKSKTFLVMYNPTSYEQGFQNTFDLAKVDGGKDLLKFKRINPNDFKIDLLFDATGVSGTGESSATGNEIDLTSKVKGKDTSEAITLLLDELNLINGDTHNIRFVQIEWGGQLFRGLLKSAKINHTLFKPNGKPIRSKLTLEFKEHIALKEQLAASKRTSPDLTKFIQVKGESRLPLMAFDEYENGNFYLEIARVNRLDNFRKLNAGQRLRFPPVEK